MASNAARIAAVAALLMVCAPIVIGYAVSFEEVPREGWESSGSYNITDLLLNSYDEYYLSSTSTDNNGSLLAEYAASGVYTVVTPAYVSTSSTPSSMPIYDSTSGRTDASYTVAYNGQTNNIEYGSTFPTGQAAYRIHCSELSQLTVYDGSSIALFGTDWIVYRTDGHYTIYGHEQYTINDVSGAFTVASDRSPVMSVAYYSTASIPDNPTVLSAWAVVPYSDNVSSTINTDILLSMTINGATVTAIAPASDFDTVTVSGSTVITSAQTYTGVTSVSYAPLIRPDATSGYVLYTSSEATGQYADPSAGWRLPTSSTTPAYYYWTNGAENQTVTMYVHLPNSAFFGVQVNDTGTEVIVSRSAEGMVTINGDTTVSLGNYEYLQVSITTSELRISGLRSWPAMWSNPTILSSVTVPITSSGEHISMIELLDGRNEPSASLPTYRVDTCQIVAGQYGATEDLTLDMTQYYPSQSWAVELNSVGVYGDSIGIGSETYQVVDNRITVGGRSYAVRDLVIGATQSDNGWSVVLNGDEVTTLTESPTITFGGLWSLTATAHTMEPMTGTTTEWQAGGFGLDADGFLQAALIVALACMVLLGMVGRRSGSKVAWLAIVCGLGGMIVILLL